MPWRDDLPSSTFRPPPSPLIFNQDRVFTFVQMKSSPSPCPSHPLAATFCASSATSADAGDSLGALAAVPSSAESARLPSQSA